MPAAALTLASTPKDIYAQISSLKDLRHQRCVRSCSGVSRRAAAVGRGPTSQHGTPDAEIDAEIDAGAAAVCVESMAGRDGGDAQFAASAVGWR